ncbi:hypothetical protein [Megalodesulfovibrio paquesii]
MWMSNSFWRCDGAGRQAGPAPAFVLALALGLGTVATPAASRAADPAPDKTAAPAEANATDNATDAEAAPPSLANLPLQHAVNLELPLRARNPFTQPRTSQAAPTQQEPGMVSVRFDGSSPEGAFQGDPRLIPRLKVVGVLDNGQSICVLAELESRGRVVLREKEQFFLKDGKSNKDDALWFTVERISHKGMALRLKDGMVVEGNFF